jgi:eukaryotic-like serine/threonine-protein kinase
MSIETIFAAASQKPMAERNSYLNEACGTDVELRRKVDRLLAAHDAAGEFLESPAHRPAATVDYVPISEKPGTMIGPYKLKEQIGEGGFGLVFVAEQQEPVKRKVALKVIKPGMDTREVMARFTAERQALALMDHPNIARVLDAGATDSGRPYFVMELVRGIPITDYCDQNQLSPRDRLDLFITVCQAVQHAHQKGIIHRDIKPSNVLVTSHDGKPVAKVIDFGVAKAIHQQLTDRSIYTNFAQMIGTPLYMSPEQAEMSGLDIDTRSDIYSLGVLLYELLTGTTPLDKKRFAKAAYDEIRRMIREDEPQKPSTRLSTSDSIASIAAQRHIEPAKLSKLVRGDLDWITMKALEKDRTGRYETANGLARDIQRYLSDEPVEAGPPNRVYRLRKFVRRNKRGSIMASLVVLALLAGLASTAWQAHKTELARLDEAEQRRLAEANAKQANEQRERAEEEKRISTAVRVFLEKSLLRQLDANKQADSLLRIGRPAAEAELDPRISVLLDRTAAELAPDRIESIFPNLPVVQAEILCTIGDTYRGIGKVSAAIVHLERARDLHVAKLGPDHPGSLHIITSLSEAYFSAGRLPEAIRLMEQVRDSDLVKRGPEDPNTLITLGNLAMAYRAAGRLPEAIQLLEQVRDVRIAKLGANDRKTLKALHGLADAYYFSGRLPEAVQLFKQVADAQVAKLGADHPDTLTALNDLAVAYRDMGKLADAKAILERVRDLQVAKRGAEHPFTLTAMNNLALVLRASGETNEAIQILEQVRDVKTRTMGPDHPGTLLSMHNLAYAYKTAGRSNEAILLYEKARDGRMAKLGPAHPDTIETMQFLFDAYRENKMFDQAISLGEETLKLMKGQLGAENKKTLTIMNDLGTTYWAANRLDRSTPLFEEAVRLHRVTFGPNSVDTLKAILNLGINYADANRLQEAISALEEFMTLSQDRREPLPASMNFAWGKLAVTYDRAGMFDKSPPLHRKAVEYAKARFGPADPRTADTLASFGHNLLENKQPAEAETVLRECLSIRQAKAPDAWTTFNTTSQLGGALLVQKKYDEAEPLLLAGYEGLKHREKKMPKDSTRISEAIERLVQLYEATDKKDEAAKWQKELEAIKAAKPEAKP